VAHNATAGFIPSPSTTRDTRRSTGLIGLEQITIA
jgi:hypothetical protein